MKKIIAILLMLALVFSFTACGDDIPDGSPNGTLKTDETDDTQNEDVPLSMGQAEGNVYESKFIGIGFKLPENWIFYTQEEINKINNIAADMVDEDIAETLANADIIYDMYAQDNTTGNSVNINLEKMNLISSAFNTAEQYTQLACTDLKDALLSMGYEEVIANATTVTFAGEECHAVDVVATAENVMLYEKIVCKKVGSYMVNITVATIGADERTSVLDKFYTLD